MIIESNPMVATSSAKEIFAYISENSKNERIELLEGNLWTIENALVDAQQFNRKHGIRHFQISSKETLSDEQFRDMIRRVKEEFDIQDRDVVFSAIHTFIRSDRDADKRHVHLGVRMVNAENGRVKRFDNIYQRQEKISRIAEIDYGFASVKGKHNKAVWHCVDDKYKEDIAKLCEGNLPHAAMSKGTIRKLTKLGKNTCQIKQDIKAIFQHSETFSKFKEAIKTKGYQITNGTKKPEMLIIVDEDNNFLGSVNRLVGIKKKELDSLVASPDSLIDNFIIRHAHSDTTVVNNLPKFTHEESLKHSSVEQKASVSSVKNNSVASSGSISVVHSEKAQTSENMTKEQKQAIYDFNENEAKKDEQLRITLAEQKKFNESQLSFDELLESLLNNFESGYSHLPKEPWSNPQDRVASDIEQKLHARLDDLRDAYLKKKAKWFSRGKAELKAFNDVLTLLKIKQLDNFDIINNQNDFNYLLKNKAAAISNFRERKRRDWFNSLDVCNYLKYKQEVKRLYDYIKKNNDLELLLKSYKNPYYGYQMMLLKEKQEDDINKNNRRIVESVKKVKSKSFDYN
ncbi:unnamed protein product [Commensalibacter communis]|uniref:relaxase/mobilization nuclease domain-containing protein n=1 Tax=Commensalibacter communis TaxID=2972786 RepID=UPI0022FF59BF|nr:hypothetical protein [Commensalibacter communis]CAI3947642.1 unnamed protein product [Commensalibacter communis]